MNLDQLLLSLAEASPVALVAIFAMWRNSKVTCTLATALVETVKAQSHSVTELVEKTVE